MSGGRAHHESAQPASARSPFSERVVEKLDSFRGLFRASVSGAQVTTTSAAFAVVQARSQHTPSPKTHPRTPSLICPYLSLRRPRAARTVSRLPLTRPHCTATPSPAACRAQSYGALRVTYMRRRRVVGTLSRPVARRCRVSAPATAASSASTVPSTLSTPLCNLQCRESTSGKGCCSSRAATDRRPLTLSQPTLRNTDIATSSFEAGAAVDQTGVDQVAAFSAATTCRLSAE